MSGRLEPGYTDLLLITDGDDHGSLPASTARLLSEEGIALYVVGAGDPQTGARIPVPDGNGQGMSERLDAAVSASARPSEAASRGRISDALPRNLECFARGVGLRASGRTGPAADMGLRGGNRRDGHKRRKCRRGWSWVAQSPK